MSIHRFLTCTLLFLSVAWAPGARAGVAHSVTGSGSVDLNDDLGLDISFRTTVAARSDETGAASGYMVLEVDLAEFDLGDTHVLARVDCLHVSGSSAWVGGTIVRSSQPDIFLVGDPVMTMVFDLGGPGEDVLHTESPFAGSCEDEPGLFPSVVDHGNFHVR